MKRTPQICSLLCVQTDVYALRLRARVADQRPVQISPIPSRISGSDSLPVNATVLDGALVTVAGVLSAGRRTDGALVTPPVVDPEPVPEDGVVRPGMVVAVEPGVLLLVVVAAAVTTNAVRQPIVRPLPSAPVPVAATV